MTANEGERRRARSVARRRSTSRWGIVICPDGPRSVDLIAVRRAMTRMLVAGELTDQPLVGLARKAGISRSTVSRMLNGRRVGIRPMMALLAVLGLRFEEVISDPTPTNGASEA